MGQSSAGPRTRGAPARPAPGLHAGRCATLALGIGGATALFSVAHAVILRPLPYADPDRLALVWQSDLERGQPFVEMSYPAFRRLARGQPGLRGAWPACRARTSPGRSAAVASRSSSSAASSPGASSDVLGVQPALGRTFTAEDDRRGAARVAVLSQRLWRERFAADPGIVGRSLVLDREPFTVVGVMPEGFAYPAGVELWTPLVPGVSELAEQPGVFWMSALGRLKPGVSLEQARRDMAAFSSSYNREKYQAPGITAVVTPLAEAVLRPDAGGAPGAARRHRRSCCWWPAPTWRRSSSSRWTSARRRWRCGSRSGRAPRASAAACSPRASCSACWAEGSAWLGALAGVPLLVALSPRRGAAARRGRARHDDARLRARRHARRRGRDRARADRGGRATARCAKRSRAARAAWRPAAAGCARRSSRAEVALALVLLVGAGLLVRSFVALRDAPLGFDGDARAGLRRRRVGEQLSGARAAAPLRRGARRPGCRRCPASSPPRR